MPPLPVITNVYRVTLNFRAAGGLPCHNVLHFFGATGGASDLATELETALDASYTDMLAAVSTVYGVSDVDIIKLNGDAPTTNHLIGNHGGQASGDFVPNTASIVTLRTDSRGRSHRGRVYLGPVGEAAIDDGVLAAGVATSIQDGWEAFIGQMTAAEFPLHVASYTLEESNSVQSVTAQPVLGTQRRRQSRLRT